MKRFQIFIALSITFFLVSFTRAQVSSPAVELFDKMTDAMSKVKTASFTLKVKERINGKFIFDEYVVKMQSTPFKTYVLSVKPNPGAEALYQEGCNNGKCLISPNKFPYFNMNLNPHSMLLRKNHQYNIMQMGFDYMLNLLNHYVRDYGKSFANMLYTTNEEQTGENSRFYYLVIDNPSFKFLPYTVKKGETLVSIGEKLHVNDHMILEKNPSLDDYDEIKAGKTILVPNSFARKIVLRIDKNNFLPVAQSVYDDQGLYSYIEYQNLVANPKLSAIDFSSDNPAYGF